MIIMYSFCINLVIFYPAHTFEITCGVTGGIFVIVVIISLVLYRNWKYEQELDSLLWKVDFRDIQLNEEVNTTHGTKTARVSFPFCNMMRAFAALEIGTAFCFVLCLTIG